MKITLKIFVIVLFAGFLMAAKPVSSYAYWHGHGRTFVGVNLGVWPGPYYGYGYGYPYPYYADPYYVSPAPSYAVVSSSYQPVVVNGVTYYLNNGVYYIYTQYGYQAVATPAGASAPAAVTAPAVADTDDSFTINVPNDKGGYTAVLLKRSGNGFLGPQGEFYAQFPKVSQLKVMYGK